eukprot:CAMPEP_0180507050 /NCGR_PEP_ID=MMETSP1036_2-20121128/48356_1 /TAXON_ID=632150 /ORGANISM="Azadinium spinosum, Strain 3D9" /LENGTH=85 /DNA_ID=CAMNT_0022517113 /DNA_START=77 /DNA_END=331 /DNA_ORIENTATION=+
MTGARKKLVGALTLCIFETCWYLMPKPNQVTRQQQYQGGARSPLPEITLSAAGATPRALAPVLATYAVTRRPPQCWLLGPSRDAD